jgi:hypothetical protein
VVQIRPGPLKRKTVGGRPLSGLPFSRPGFFQEFGVAKVVAIAEPYGFVPGGPSGSQHAESTEPTSSGGRR